MRLLGIEALVMTLILFINSSQIDKIPLSQVTLTSATNQWKLYASCKEQVSQIDTNKNLSLASCLTGNVFHVDGPQLLQVVTKYVCASSDRRGSIVFTVNPPKLATALNAIVVKKLQKPETSKKDRDWMQPIAKEYLESLQRGSRMFPLLLRKIIVALEKDSKTSSTQHKRSEKVQKSLIIPAGCKFRRSESDTRRIVAISYEVIQRFSQMHWRRVTDMIARANKIVDVEAAKLIIPRFVLSASTVDSVSRIYGVTAPGNGTYPKDFVEIDIAMNNSKYSRFAVPLTELPGSALKFLGEQSAVLNSQIKKVISAIKEGQSTTVISVPPDSIRVFSNTFWVEHVIWQIAFREVLLNEGISLDQSQYQTYGLS